MSDFGCLMKSSSFAFEMQTLQLVVLKQILKTIL